MVPDETPPAHTPLRDLKNRTQLKGLVTEPVNARAKQIRDALANEGFGDVSLGDLLGAFVADCEIETKDGVEQLFKKIRRYRKMTIGQLLRDQKADIVRLPIRPVGRPSRQRPTGDP